MNTLDMPMNYVPALDEQDAVGKDAGMETLPVDLMALIDDCSADWANDDSEDLLAALGGESFEQALEEGVTLLDGGCGLIEEDVMDFVAEEIAAAPCADVESEAQPAETADGALSQPTTPCKHVDPLLNPAFLSPFSLCSIKYADKAACHPGENIWKKFEFPTDVARDESTLVDLKEYAKKFQKRIPHIDWDAELAYYEPAAEKSSKRKGVKEERDIMWSLPQCDLAYLPLPMLTPAQLRRKLMGEDTPTRPGGADAAVAVTPDNSLLLANRSTTVPAASAMKSRPMRSLLNTKQQQQHVVKTSSRSLLLPTARTKVQAAAGPAATHAVVKQKAPATTCDPVPPAETSVEIKASRFTGPEGEPLTSSRPETPQSITESEDEAPVFRHNTIDTIFTSSMCDPSSSTVYLTPSDSSGSPKSTIGDEDDDDDEEEEEEEDYEHQSLRSPPESVIREERPARTVLPYISDHSYHLSKSNVRIDGLGVQTPSDSGRPLQSEDEWDNDLYNRTSGYASSDSEEEIDVVSVGGDKGTARLPNNPTARDRRQIQMKVATAIHRQSRHDAADSPSASRKRQAAPATGRSSSSVKRARNATAPLVLGRGKGKGKAFGAGRGRRRANADEEPDPCEKRSMHNSMERQRRIDLRNLVERLRTVVPATENNKRAAKVVILREAAKFCHEVTATVDSQEVELRSLRSQQTGLQRKLSSLRTELAVIRMRDEQGSCFGNEYFTVEEIKPEPVEVDEDFREYGGF
ncbi:uncharacterized protein LOC124788281 isoform X1 [Schistocerca piceifrons]|uniref:uncharacterized protein LOC124788281 isoform X1 n=1 Tax=Schistocerca piceifrons TaxID=274613 RepID=UPI001F5EF4B7|nr:uncharacterized protein LOC124788281 isoform X1 [Schistocerca piceifrons]